MLIVGGSDAGISAALRARELDPGADVRVVLADAYPNFSICGIPYLISREVSDWHALRTAPRRTWRRRGSRSCSTRASDGSTRPDTACW